MHCKRRDRVATLSWLWPPTPTQPQLGIWEPGAAVSQAKPSQAKEAGGGSYHRRRGPCAGGRQAGLAAERREMPAVRAPLASRSTKKPPPFAVRKRAWAGQSRVPRGPAQKLLPGKPVSRRLRAARRPQKPAVEGTLWGASMTFQAAFGTGRGCPGRPRGPGRRQTLPVRLPLCHLSGDLWGLVQAEAEVVAPLLGWPTPGDGAGALLWPVTVRLGGPTGSLLASACGKRSSGAF